VSSSFVAWRAGDLVVIVDELCGGRRRPEQVSATSCLIIGLGGELRIRVHALRGLVSGALAPEGVGCGPAADGIGALLDGHHAIGFSCSPPITAVSPSWA
jgi:hypothetical protein